MSWLDLMATYVLMVGRCNKSNKLTLVFLDMLHMHATRAPVRDNTAAVHKFTVRY